MTAAYNPRSGETPEATAIAIDSGSATIATVNAAMIPCENGQIVSLGQNRCEFWTIEMCGSGAVGHCGQTDLDSSIIAED